MHNLAQVIHDDGGLPQTAPDGDTLTNSCACCLFCICTRKLLKPLLLC